jgi:hypothetical protein
VRATAPIAPDATLPDRFLVLVDEALTFKASAVAWCPIAWSFMSIKKNKAHTDDFQIEFGGESSTVVLYERRRH